MEGGEGWKGRDGEKGVRLNRTTRNLAATPLHVDYNGTSHSHGVVYTVIYTFMHLHHGVT